MRSRRHAFAFTTIAVASAIACAPILGLDDLQERIPDAGGSASDAQPDVSRLDAADSAPSNGTGDAAADAEGGSACSFVDVTDPSVVDNPDYASFPMPNLGAPNAFNVTDDGTVVTDNVTGLKWLKSVGGPASFATAKAQCEAASTGGLAWRLPTRVELTSTSLHNNPTEDYAPYSPCTPSNFALPPPGYPLIFWSSTDAAEGAAPRKKWTFQAGSCGVQPDADPGAEVYYRCVSGVRKAPAFQVSTECGLVRDLNTGLEWERGWTQRNPAREDGGTPDNVKEGCAGLGLEKPRLGSGWRVPSYTELSSVIDSSRVGPAFSKVLFGDDIPTAGKWATSDNRGLLVIAVIESDDGHENGALFSEPLYVRCVRRLAR